MERDLSKTPSLREQYAAFSSWFVVLCQALEASIVVFLRRGFGARYFGVQAAAVIPVVFIYSLFWRGHDPVPLLVFLGLYLVGVAMARIGTQWRKRRGDVQHSHYSGTPIILRWKVFRGRLSERRAKTLVEPVLVFLLGLLIRIGNQPLGVYLMLAAGGLMLSMQLALAYDRQRIMDLRDAYLEQQTLSERLRERGWS